MDKIKASQLETNTRIRVKNQSPSIPLYKVANSDCSSTSISYIATAMDEIKHPDHSTVPHHPYLLITLNVFGEVTRNGCYNLTSMFIAFRLGQSGTRRGSNPC
ncbi:hypothetical protein L6452_30632 [Arctium lappa]|uniref:Uncharacterized protein n=1 Tax=Arctium lappa TaxID=4217 RepID=A0ACB8ZJQ1_ARCLA|nr:hypothetical protein L6452_30632 [Arctium lappa]